MFPNLPDMHRTAGARLGSRVALRYKHNGRYHDLSWTDYREQADQAAAGLIEQGVQPGDRVALLSENRLEWLIADHAMLSAGAITVPLHAPLAAGQVEYQLAHSEAVGVIVSNQDQADKVVRIRESLPGLKFLITFEPVATPDSLHTLTWQELKQRGQARGLSGLHEVRKREADLTGDDLATIIYTSGTTGPPKGVMLTHANLLSNALATLEVSAIGPTDVLLSWLPYSHIYARTVDHYMTSLGGVTVALAESAETVRDNLQEVLPTWVTAVPRLYEKIWADVQLRSVQERRDELHRIVGPRIRHLSSGGAPLPRHVCEGFFEAGIPLLEGYGLTESSPVICFNTVDHYKIGTVGRPVSGVEVRIAPDGEILTRGPHVMRGYWKDPQATAQTITDGWLHTGDVGHLDDEGFLTITDRKKDLIVLSTGKNVAPSELERLLVSDEYIDQAVVYGDGHAFIAALIVPNFQNLQAKLDEWNCDPAIEDDFIRDRVVLDFYHSRVESLMLSVSRPERVKQCLLLARSLTLADDELTATLKVRRRYVIQKYQAALAELYETASTSSQGAPP